MSEKRRILIIDDNPEIHRDFKKVMLPKETVPDTELDALEARLFAAKSSDPATPKDTAPKIVYEVDSAHQGEEGLKMVEAALKEGRPYALAFVDVRMPPGWDGIETIQKIWKSCPHTEAVICTSYSDYSSEEIEKALGISHRLLLLKKPFDPVVLKLMAMMLTTKWNLEEREKNHIEDLERSVSARTKELSSAITELNLANTELDSNLRKLHDSQLALLQSSKMSALGEMAAGLAHEINNPLAIIHTASGILQELVDEVPLDSATIKELAKRIETTDLRIARIVSSLKTYSRDGGKDPFQKTLLGQIVQDTLELCKEKFHNSETLLRLPEYSKELALECRATQLVQVLLNLINNAYDAVQTLKERWLELKVVDDADHIQIHITDSGNGIPESAQKQIFQSFFTTKSVGKGTGLGLSISKGIVEEHGGTLALDTTSKNTTFVVRVPKKQVPKA